MYPLLVKEASIINNINIAIVLDSDNKIKLKK